MPIQPLSYLGYRILANATTRKTGYFWPNYCILRTV